MLTVDQSTRLESRIDVSTLGGLETKCLERTFWSWLNPWIQSTDTFDTFMRQSIHPWHLASSEFGETRPHL